MKNLPKRIKYKGQIYEAMDRTNIDVVEIKLVPEPFNPLSEEQDYEYTSVVVSHDGGKDKIEVLRFNTLQELSNEDFGQIVSDYIDKVL